MMKQKVFQYTALMSVAWFASAIAVFALDAIDLDDLRKRYPACTEAETWNYCYGERTIKGTASEENQKGMFKGGNLWTGNIYFFNELQSVCHDNNCETVPSCEYSVLRQQYECKDGDKFWGFDIDSKGNRQGRGVYVWENGSKYEGEAKDDHWHGQGVKTYNDGSTHTGQYENDLPHGFGVYVSAEGWIYKGNFKEGMFDGQGEYTYPDGTRYVGQFLNDKFNGYGVMYYTDGTKQVGLWVDDNYVGD